MAQTTAPQKTLTFRAITRRPRSSQPPPTPRLHRQDFAWIALFAAITICLRVATIGVNALSRPETYLSTATVVFLYFLGFRVRDRATAVISAALLATSPLFAAPTEAPTDLLFVLFTIAALALYGASADSWVVLCAMIVAAGAAIIRPEGILLGAVLLGFMLTEQRPGWVVGTVVYFLLTAAGLAGLVLFQHQHVPIPTVRLELGPILSLFGTQTAIVWFIWLMFVDLGDSIRRARWKPVIVWSVLFLCVESLFHFNGYSFESGPFRPVLFLFAAGGIARLLPVVAGDFANPAVRYVVAVLAVGTLIYAEVHAEWPLAHRLQMTASSKAIPAITQHPIVTSRAPRSHRSATHGLVKIASLPKAAILAAMPMTAASKEHPGVPHHVVFVPPGALKPAQTTKPVAPRLAVKGPPPAVLHSSGPPAHVASTRIPAVSTPPSKAVIVHPAPTVHVVQKPQPQKVATVHSPPPHLAPTRPMTLAAQAAAAGIRMYTVRRGHVVARNPWAIRWDIAHSPKRVAGKPVSKPTTHPAITRIAAVPPHKLAPKPAVRPTITAKAPPHPVVSKPIVRVAPPHPVVAKRLPPATHSTSHPIVVIPGVPMSLATQAAAAGVPVYYVRHGHNLPRTTWAIRWDITHKSKAPPHIAAAAPAKAHTPALAHRKTIKAAHLRRARATAHPRKAIWRRPVHKKRHRSIWAIRWTSAHPAQ